MLKFVTMLMMVLLIHSPVNAANAGGKSRSPKHNNPTTPGTVFTADDGRLLASNCFQCHGTNGVSVTQWDSIAGENDLMNEFYDDHPLMHAQAIGYTATEIDSMASWLSAQPSNGHD